MSCTTSASCNLLSSSSDGSSGGGIMGLTLTDYPFQALEHEYSATKTTALILLHCSTNMSMLTFECFEFLYVFLE